MKKTLIYLIGIAAAIATFPSCNIKNQGDDMWGGLSLYDNADRQQLVSIEPFNVAMRLHILLSETEKQGLDDFEKTKVEYKAKDNFVSLRGIMFDDGNDKAKIELIEDGVYKITYPANYQNDAMDTQKTGSITIYTGNRLLNEPGASWSVMTGQTGADKFSVKIENNSIELNATNYFITNTGSDIELFAYDIGAKWGNVMSNWEMKFEIRKTNAGDLYGYENIAKAEFEVEGDAQGTTMFNASHHYTYEFSEPAKFKAVCTSAIICNPESSVPCQDIYISFPILRGQVDIFVFPGSSPLDPEVYPARSVRMKWDEIQSGECQFRRTMFYNGKSLIL